MSARTFPIFTLSRNEIRYRKESYAILSQMKSSKQRLAVPKE
jgi:hypothetical protein